MHDWLTHNDSLTDKLKTISSAVHLQVLQHAWQTTVSQEHILERKILMWAGQERCWFARTQIPEPTYRAEEALFSRLATQALGELIWHNPRIQRVQLQHYAITPNTADYALLDNSMHEQHTSLWARHSRLFVQNQYPFYLLEIFLPGLARVIS
jgi:chorismate--pyruvate lyase